MTCFTTAKLGHAADDGGRCGHLCRNRQVRANRADKLFFDAIAASEEPDLPYYGGLLELSEGRLKDHSREGESIRRRHVAATLG